MADRVRMQNQAMSLVMFSQGVPFFHAGDELLRSKSMDRNSYNSGDWYNAIDWTYTTNNWGRGLPPAGANSSNYGIIQPLLANPDLAASTEDIQVMHQNFLELLRIRKSSALFRLQTEADILARMKFHGVGPDQPRGLIVMSISDLDDSLEDLDPGHELVVVLFNSNPSEITFTEAALVGVGLELHPIQVSSSDAVVQTSSFDSATGTFTVPGRTTAVFVLKQQ
jgi:pullulanase/glycogen debranching enzyme